MKIMSFSQQGPRAICVLSANGAVSTATLRQPSTSGGTVTYEVEHLITLFPFAVRYLHMMFDNCRERLPISNGDFFLIFL